MKRLILIRHAKSSWSDYSIDDFDRSLNKRGERDAPFMAQKLAEKGIKPDLIVSSPAKRAIICEKVYFSEHTHRKTCFLRKHLVSEKINRKIMFPRTKNRTEVLDPGFGDLFKEIFRFHFFPEF